MGEFHLAKDQALDDNATAATTNRAETAAAMLQLAAQAIKELCEVIAHERGQINIKSGVMRAVDWWAGGMAIRHSVSPDITDTPRRIHALVQKEVINLDLAKEILEVAELAARFRLQAHSTTGSEHDFVRTPLGAGPSTAAQTDLAQDAAALPRMQAIFTKLLALAGLEINIVTPTPHEASSSNAPRRVRVIVHEGNPIQFTEQLTIGRNRDSTFFINKNHISRQHCVITVEDDGCYIVDQSSNGTQVGNKRLEPKQKRRLEPGDIILLSPGDNPVKLQFQLQ